MSSQTTQLSPEQVFVKTLQELIKRTIVECRNVAEQSSPTSAPAVFLECVAKSLAPLLERIRSNPEIRMLLEAFDINVEQLLKVAFETAGQSTSEEHPVVKALKAQAQALANKLAVPLAGMP